MHHTAERIENGLRSEVLGGNQVDKVLLAVFLLGLGSAITQHIVPGMTYLLEDVEHSRVGVLKGGREKLQQGSILQLLPSGNPLYATVPFAEHPGWMTLLPARGGLWGYRDERIGRRQDERSQRRDGQDAHSERETWRARIHDGFARQESADALYRDAACQPFLTFPVARGKRETALSPIGLTASERALFFGKFWFPPFFLHTTKSKMKRRRSICVSTRR